jgi:hypothetical protein
MIRWSQPCSSLRAIFGQIWKKPADARLLGCGHCLGAAVAAHRRIPFKAAAGDVHSIPATVGLSFYTGAAAFFGAVMWTIVSTPEYPPVTWKSLSVEISQSQTRMSARDTTQSADGSW